MHRTQIYLTEEQEKLLARRARAESTSKAAVIRQILDRELLGVDSADQDDAVIRSTAGVCADYPDWPEWLADVRGAGGSARLDSLGL